MAHREVGTVKWYNLEKGYGFIQRDRGNDLFVHESEIRGRMIKILHEGQVVEFGVAQSERGPKAVDVTTPWYA